MWIMVGDSVATEDSGAKPAQRQRVKLPENRIKTFAQIREAIMSGIKTARLEPFLRYLIKLESPRQAEIQFRALVKWYYFLAAESHNIDLKEYLIPQNPSFITGITNVCRTLEDAKGLNLRHRFARLPLHPSDEGAPEDEEQEWPTPSERTDTPKSKTKKAA
jgi:hypothetical protein